LIPFVLLRTSLSLRIFSRPLYDNSKKPLGSRLYI
jgi:hypothetical protein